MSSSSPGGLASALPRPGVLAATAAILLTVLVTAAGAGASGAVSHVTLATVSPVPKACPSRSVIRAALHLNVRHVIVQAGPLSSTVTNGFSPPTAQNTTKNTGYERTCTYSTTAAPVTISYVAPVTTVTFNQSRMAARKGGPVVVVHDLGDAAWASKGNGELFVLLGTLEVVVSMQQTTTAQLQSLASQVLPR